MNTTKEELNLKIEKVLMHTTLNEYAQYELITGFFEEFVNQQVLQALEEVKSKQQNLWTEMASDGNEYRIKAVPLSAIEQIEEKYR